MPDNKERTTRNVTPRSAIGTDRAQPPQSAPPRSRAGAPRDAGTRPAAKSASTADSGRDRTSAPLSRNVPPASGRASTPVSRNVPTERGRASAPVTRTSPAERGKTPEQAKKADARQASAMSAPPGSAQEKPPAQRTRATEKPTREESPKPVSAPPSRRKSEKVKPEKPQGKGGSGGVFGGVAAAIKRNKKKSIIIAAVSFAVILALVLSLVLGLRSCSDEPQPSGFNPVGVSSRYDTDFTTNTKVGFYGEVKGTTERVKPVEEVKNDGEVFGNSAYPQYGRTLNAVIGGSADKQTARRNLIRESSYLTSSNTWNGGGGGYKWMDENGYLFSGTRAQPAPVYYDGTQTQRQLYKHTAANGLYGGNVSDDEPAIVKTVKMQPRGYSGYGVTGVYAPAGEVIKIELDEADMNATGGIQIHIGQALYNGKANNIWVEKNQMQRFPIILNTMVVDKTTSVYDEIAKKYTAYVGSFVGGPLYIRNEGVTFTVTISGGVRYSHFILGYTTKSEFEENAKSSAPYFDLEVWDRGVLHSGPKAYAKNFSYEDLYKAAVLWDKVASVTTTNGSNQGIVFIYDPFVAAGAAVAFPGQMSVNCPTGWMSSSLNYKQMISSGAWGNFHEYHHNFQNFGVGYTGEVTNNALTLVSYSLFTEISQARQPSAYGGAGLSGWNQYTSAPWALQRVNSGAITDTNGLAVYSTLLHSFGQSVFIAARNRSGANYFNRISQLTTRDLSYYAQKVSAYAGSLSLTANEYPMYIPAATVYQTGGFYEYNGKKQEFTTMRPYIIPYGAPFTVDLRPYNAPGGQYASGSVVLDGGFTYSIKSVNADNIDGKFVATDTDNVYTFIPGKKLLSGKIYVTLEVTTASGEHTYNGKEIADVELILEFEQSHETNRTSLRRTTYSYDESKYTDAEAAYNAGFAGYTDKEEIDHTNPVQNCNTDIWFYADTEQMRNDHPNAPDHYFLKENTICVLDGKLYADDDGTYRIYLRGRMNCALYYSTDGGRTYRLGATVKDEDPKKTSSGFRLNDENTYFDLELKAGDWVYVKEVLICCMVSGNSASFIGVGMSKWTKPMFTMVDKYYDKDGKEVASPEAEGYDHTKTHYFNYLGIEVTEEEANSSQPIPPTSASYVNAYRSTYEKIVDEFETDYFYTRKYTYGYSDNLLLTPAENEPTYTVIASNYDINECKKIVDGNSNTGFERWGDALNKMSSPDGDPAHNGLWFTVDMGLTKTVNRMKLFSRVHNNDGALIKSFIIQGSVDGEQFSLLKEVKNINVGSEYTVDFDRANIRYYRFIITDSNYQHSGIRFNEIEVWYSTEVHGGNLIAPDDETLKYGSVGWHGAQEDSTFGHIYVGNQYATLSFEFEGTRIGILSSKAWGRNFEVFIDGRSVGSVGLKKDDSATALVYLCDKLSSGKHTVTVKCTGEANIDSIVIFNEA